ncbi:MAG TPA: ATP phosphoribosyltransferase regulatory subunit, partial [Rubellimicrobium sp.]|nr:ATP phosphoribosyltransferase regulatory subunit [Rubellimicrobium sp.]
AALRGSLVARPSTAARRRPISPMAALDRLGRRLDALNRRGLDPSGIAFEGSFGRTTLEYYDGFVFGLFADGSPELPAVATGGRYDALTRVLGRGREVPAVGGVIRPELVVRLRTLP